MKTHPLCRRYAFLFLLVKTVQNTWSTEGQKTTNQIDWSPVSRRSAWVSGVGRKIKLLTMCPSVSWRRCWYWGFSERVECEDHGVFVHQDDTIEAREKKCTTIFLVGLRHMVLVEKLLELNKVCLMSSAHCWFWWWRVNVRVRGTTSKEKKMHIQVVFMEGCRIDWCGSDIGVMGWESCSLHVAAHNNETTY